VKEQIFPVSSLFLYFVPSNKTGNLARRSSSNNQTLVRVCGTLLLLLFPLFVLFLSSIPYRSSVFFISITETFVNCFSFSCHYDPSLIVVVFLIRTFFVVLNYYYLFLLFFFCWNKNQENWEKKTHKQFREYVYSSSVTTDRGNSIHTKSRSIYMLSVMRE